LLEQLDEVTATAEATAITAAQVTAERDILTQTLSDTQHQLELERAKTDSAQGQLADLRSSFDQQAKELNTNISRVATLEATAESDKAEVARLSAELEAAKTELKAVTTERNEIATATAEVKGELKAVTIERDKLSGLHEQLTQRQNALNTDYQLLVKQYETISTSYSAEQEKSSALTIELEKMQAALDKDLD
jgi:chromosome segregation ATPase